MLENLSIGEKFKKMNLDEIREYVPKNYKIIQKTNSENSSTK